MSNPKKNLATRSDVVCENKPEERVALALPTTQIAEAADQLIENVTADNMYSVYKIMDCEDKYTNASQKVFLAAATATTVSTAMIATKALLGSYHTFNALTDRVNELEAKLATTEEDLEECEETVEEQEVELEEQERDIELKDEQIFIQEEELEEQEAEIAEQKEEIAEQEVELEIVGIKLDILEVQIAEKAEELENCEENVEKLEDALDTVLELVDNVNDTIDDTLGGDDGVDGDTEDTTTLSNPPPTITICCFIKSKASNQVLNSHFSFAAVCTAFMVLSSNFGSKLFLKSNSLF